MRLRCQRRDGLRGELFVDPLCGPFVDPLPRDAQERTATSHDASHIDRVRIECDASSVGN